MVVVMLALSRDLPALLLKDMERVESELKVKKNMTGL